MKTWDKDAVYSYELKEWCVMFHNKTNALNFAFKIQGKIHKLFDTYAVTKS